MTITREVPDDELVAKGAFVHLERMDTDEFFLVVDEQRYNLTAVGPGVLEWKPEDDWIQAKRMRELEPAWFVPGEEKVPEDPLNGPRSLVFGFLIALALWLVIGAAIVWLVL